MSNEWNDIVKELSPHEKAAVNERLEEAANKDRYLVRELLSLGSTWNDNEQKRLLKLLGWEMMGKDYHWTKHTTGKEEFVFTSKTTFERREKVNWSVESFEIIRADKTKIQDLHAFEELTNEIMLFCRQAKDKFGDNVNPLRRKIDTLRSLFGDMKLFFIPVLFLLEILSVLVYMLLEDLIPISNMSTWLLIVIPCVALLISGGIAVFRECMEMKKNAPYLPLIKAYRNNVKEFEKKIQQITFNTN